MKKRKVGIAHCPNSNIRQAHNTGYNTLYDLILQFKEWTNEHTGQITKGHKNRTGNRFEFVNELRYTIDLKLLQTWLVVFLHQCLMQ